MAESFGMNINMSLVNDEDGNYSMGIHYNDSEGVDVESKGDGDDWSELVTGLFTDIFDDILKQKKEKEKKVEETPEEKISRLMDEIQSLIKRFLDVGIEFDSPKVLGLHGIKRSFYKEIATSETKFHKGSLRSGQRIEYEGSLVIIGDVNPGA